MATDTGKNGGGTGKMGLIRTILHALEGPPQETPRETPPNHMGRVFSRTVNGYSRVKQTDVAMALREWAYACIDRRAKAVAMSDYEIYHGKGIAGEGHWAQRLWENPNPMMERYEIRTLVSKYKDTHGNAYIYTPLRKDAEGKEYPYQMWPLPASQVQVVLNAQGTHKLGYIWNSDMAGQIYLSTREVLHLRSMEPAMDTMGGFFVGTPKINACIDAIRTSAEIKAYLREFYANDAIPPLVLTSEGGIDDEAFKNMKERWNQKFPQHMIAGALENGMKIQPITRDGLGAVDKKDTSAIGEDNIRIICSVFGLNVGLLTGDYSERATAEVQKDLFMTVTIKAELQYMDDAITRHLRQFDAALKFCHKIEQYTDPTESRAAEEFDFQHGLITRNDMRKRRGLDPLPDGDVYYLAPTVMTVDSVTYGGGMGGAITDTAIPVDDVTEPAPQLPASPQGSYVAGESKGVSIAPSKNWDTVTKYDIVEIADTDDEGTGEPLPASLNDPEMAAVWKDINKAAVPFESTFERGVSNVFMDLGEEVVAAIKASGNKGIRGGLTKAQLDGTAPLFDVAKWQKKLGAKLAPDAARLIAKMMEKAVTSVGQNWNDIISTFDLESQKVLQVSLNKIKESLPTIDKEIRGLLKKNAGMDVEKLADLMNDRFANVYSKSRANAIARTTVTFTTNASQKAAWNKLGFDRRVWITERDGVVRYKHRLADGQICDEGGNFTVGGETTDHPCGDGLSAGNAVNCRCYTKVASKADLQAAGIAV